MTTIDSILAEFREAATSNRDLGDKFERLIATYLVTDPQFSDRLADKSIGKITHTSNGHLRR
jgi:predicted helicase